MSSNSYKLQCIKIATLELLREVIEEMCRPRGTTPLESHRSGKLLPLCPGYVGFPEGSGEAL